MKLRLSFSLLSTWERGETDRAIQMYFHMNSPTTRQMEEGRKIHEEISEHITQSKKLPEYLPNLKLVDPISELPLVVKYNDIFDLKVILDCLDDKKTIYEFKTGTTPVLEYVSSYQIPMYFLACEMSRIPVETSYIIHHNQYTGKSEFVELRNSGRLIRKAKNYIETIGPEIYEFFKGEGLV